MKKDKIQKILEEIKSNFEKIETQFNKLPNKTQENILNYHSFCSLNTMVRWGTQNTEELIIAIDEIGEN